MPPLSACAQRQSITPEYVEILAARLVSTFPSPHLPSPPLSPLRPGCAIHREDSHTLRHLGSVLGCRPANEAGARERLVERGGEGWAVRRCSVPRLPGRRLGSSSSATASASQQTFAQRRGGRGGTHSNFAVGDSIVAGRVPKQTVWGNARQTAVRQTPPSSTCPVSPLTHSKTPDCSSESHVDLDVLVAGHRRAASPCVREVHFRRNACVERGRGGREEPTSTWLFAIKSASAVWLNEADPQHLRGGEGVPVTTMFTASSSFLFIRICSLSDLISAPQLYPST